jgi:hypothetical protein
MSIAEVAAMRSVADAFGITPDEWSAFKHAKRDAALAFYVELRGRLEDEYRLGLPFTLPAKELAAREFLLGRRDRKLYMRLRDELIRLGLIVRVAHPGFTAEGRRRAGLFLFNSSMTRETSNVVFLDAVRRSTRGRNRDAS